MWRKALSTNIVCQREKLSLRVGQLPRRLIAEHKKQVATVILIRYLC
jgi:hypothetical protein